MFIIIIFTTIMLHTGVEKNHVVNISKTKRHRAVVATEC